MRVLIDTNILISAALFPQSVSALASIPAEKNKDLILGKMIL